jgi:hypothetical protein
MRSGDVYTDANLQGRLMPMQSLRPIIWAHARPGVVRTDGSGNISSIVTGTSLNFTQSNSSNRPPLGSVAGRPTIRTTVSKPLGSSATISSLSEFTVAVLYWQKSSETFELEILDIFDNPMGSLRNDTTPAVRGSLGSSPSDISVGQNLPIVASLVGQVTSGVLRVGSLSSIVASVYSQEDSQITLKSADACDVFEVVFFDRALQAADIRRLEGILAWSSGFPEALGGGHPYLNRPPLLGD